MRARYVVRRVFQSLVTLWLIATIAFAIFRLLPGDPTLVLLDPSFPPDVRDLLKQAFGLDKHLSFQYIRYLGNILRGEFGRSFFYAQPAIQIKRKKLI